MFEQTLTITAVNTEEDKYALLEYILLAHHLQRWAWGLGGSYIQSERITPLIMSFEY